MEAAVKLGYTKTACTEEPCKWNEDFVKKVVPARINAIKFYNTSKVAKAKSRKRRQVKQFAPATEEEQQQLIKHYMPALQSQLTIYMPSAKVYATE